MTIQRDTLHQEVQRIRGELGQLLDGMDYCCDWKPDEEEWSARDIICHLVDTPKGGVHTLVHGVLQGSIHGFDITASLSNLTPERQQKDLGQLKGDLEEVLVGMESALSSATDAELEAKVVPMHSVTRGATEDRTAQRIVEGIFIRHWSEHLVQLKELREALGLE